MSYILVQYGTDENVYFEDVSWSWGEETGGLHIYPNDGGPSDFTWVNTGYVATFTTSEVPLDVDTDDEEEELEVTQVPAEGGVFIVGPYVQLELDLDDEVEEDNNENE